MKGWEPEIKAVDAIIFEPLSPPRGRRLRWNNERKLVPVSGYESVAYNTATL